MWIDSEVFDPRRDGALRRRLEVCAHREHVEQNLWVDGKGPGGRPVGEAKGVPLVLLDDVRQRTYREPHPRTGVESWHVVRFEMGVLFDDDVENPGNALVEEPESERFTRPRKRSRSSALRPSGVLAYTL